MELLNLLIPVLAVTLTASAFETPADLRLIDAVKRRDTKAFESLLAHGPSIDTAAPDGATALAWAVFLDQQDLAEKLIAAGAKIDTSGDYGETPLTLAVANGNAALVEKLLKAGADSATTRWNGETALMISAGSGCTECAQLLIDHGADVNLAEPKSLQSPLMWAASEGHAKMVDLLIRKGANVNAVSKAGFTPLVFAAAKNEPASVKRILDAGADPNFAVAGGMKVLTLAALNRGNAAAMALLDGGADPNVADDKGTMPLHIAAQTGAIDLVRKLLAKGANTDVHTAPVKEVTFRTPPGGQTPLLLAAKFNQVEVMRTLIEAGADWKQKAQDGAGLLLAAAASGRVAAARYAFEFDKDVAQTTDTGRTAMHQCVSIPFGGATQDEMTELAQYLADIGVPLDEKDARGKTPIQTGDVIPLDKPIQRMADIIISRGGTPKYFPKEYVKPAQLP